MTDTTMGGGRGGVGIRLFTTGQEVVKRTFGQIGDSGKKMWAEIAMGEKAANPTLRAMSRASNEAGKGVQDLANRAGPAGNILGAFGAKGVVAAAALGGLAVALGKAREAMQFAADLTDTADRIGTGVEALQSWRYIADEAGVSTDALQGNMERLNAAVGAFKSGVGDGRLKPVFEALGITPEQLAQVDTADKMLLLLSDTLGRVQDRAVQVRFAKALGVEESLPIIRMGRQRLEELGDEAGRLGLIVGEDVVAALDAADRKMELAQQRIDTSLRLSVADLASDFADVVSAIASVVAWLARLDQAANSVLPRFGIDGDGSRPTNRGLAGWIGDAARGRTKEEGDAARDAQWRNQPAWMRWMGIGSQRRNYLEAQDRRVAGMAASMTDLANGTGEFSTRPGWERAPDRPRASGAADRTAERRRQEAERALEALSRLELTLHRDWLNEHYGPGGIRENRTNLRLGQNEMEEEAWNAQKAELEAQLEAAGVLDDIVRARLADLDEEQKQMFILKDQTILREEQRDLARKRLDQEKSRDEAALELLSIDEQMAVSMRDRIAISRRILVLQQELELKLLEAAADEDGLRSDDETAGVDRLRRRQGRELDLFDHNARQNLREQFRSYGHEVVDAIEEGRIGEHIGDELKARLIDMALNGVFDFLNPSGGANGGRSLISTGAQWLGGLFGLGPGRAGGGDLARGLRHPVVETGRPELLLLGGKGHVTGAAETMRLLQEMSGPGGHGGSRRSGGADFGGLQVEVIPNKELDVRIRRVARDEASQAGARAFGQSVKTSLDATPTMLADRRAYQE